MAPSCPTCGKPLEGKSVEGKPIGGESLGGKPLEGKPLEGKHSPFCSQRCAHADLGRWLSGHYAVPSMEEPDSDAIEALEKAAAEDGTLITGRFRRDS